MITPAGQLKAGNRTSCGCGRTYAKLDLTGQRFGKLVAIEDVGGSPYGRQWRCRCNCGQETIAIAGQLRVGTRVSCGCASRGKAADLTGQRFGKLVTIEDAGSTSEGYRQWRCRCECGCGREVIVPSNWLKRGVQTACNAVNHSWKSFDARRVYEYETDDEVLQAEIMFELEKEFGPTAYPAPRGSVFHQNLTSDHELECVAARKILERRSQSL